MKSELVNAPYVGEYPFVLECQLRHHFEIGSHTQFIGEIVDIKAEESVLGEGGHPLIEKIKPILFAPDDGFYYGVGHYLGKAFSIGKRL